jgi:hypothetical protein
MSKKLRFLSQMPRLFIMAGRLLMTWKWKLGSGQSDRLAELVFSLIASDHPRRMVVDEIQTVALDQDLP